MRATLRRIAERMKDDDERAFVVVWMALTIVLLIGIVAFAVDLVHAYAEAQAAQKAADAAALAGASEIPQDTTGAFAVARATKVAGDNTFTAGTHGGYTDTVIVNPPTHNTMDVTIKRTFNTWFANVFGIDQITVNKSAEAVYNGPVKMGSPANNLGDVPECPPGVPISGCKPSDVVNVAGNDNQNLWAQVMGPYTGKDQGNAYTAGYCANTFTDGCKGGTTGFGNPPQLTYTGDASGSAENIVVHNDGGAPVQLWLYDAPFVGTNPDCLRPLGGWTGSVAANYPQPPNPTTTAQYQHCAGDTDFSLSGQANAGNAPMSTFYTLYQADSDNDPSNNNTQEGSCTKTFKGYRTPTDAFAGIGTDPDILSSFHQWTSLCTFTDTGDLVLRVGSATPGEGTNSFSVLALRTDGSKSGLTVSTTEALPLFARSQTSSTSQFYVARILPSPGRDRALVLQFFDFGDEFGNPTSSGTIKFHWQGVTGAPPLKGCSWQPTQPAGALGRDDPLTSPGLVSNDPYNDGVTDPSNCVFHYNRAQWNGRWVVISIPIPGTGANAYDCVQASAQNCWLKLDITPDSGNIGDATTWNAQMNGSPVALLH